MDIFSLITCVLLILLIISVLIQKYKLKKKDKHLNLIFNRINDAVVSIDSEWKYTFLNNAALNTHPHGREETLGKVLWDVHPGLVGTIFWDTYHKAMDTGKFMEIENYYAAMDKWFLIKVYPSNTGLTIFYQDITAGKTIKNQLIKSAEKYRTLFLKSPLPTWSYDLENLRFVDVNEAAVRHYGYTRNEFLSMSIKDIRPQEEVAMLLEDIGQVQKDTDKSRYGKWRHQKKNGDILFVETTAHSFNDGGRTVRIVIINDITIKTIMEQQLLENQMKLTEAQAIGCLGNWDLDFLTNLCTWSDEVYKIFELNKVESEPSFELFLSFMHPGDREVLQPVMEQALQNFTEAKAEFRFTTSSGKKRYGYNEWRFGYDSNNNPIRLFGILQDITERKEAEEKSRLLETQIKEQKIQEQKNISRAIIKAQDQQRNYIAQELHDNINQILFGAKFLLGIAGRNDQTVKALIQPPIELINTAMHEIHLLCHNLVAPSKNIYLHEMIQDLINKQNENIANPLKIDFTYVVLSELSDELKLNIYRIIQELLNNILKHAEAKNVEIAIAIKGNCIRITVQDDGKGYNMEVKRKGLGISNIMDRVVTFNGKVTLQSNLGGGSKTDIMIPCKL